MLYIYNSYSDRPINKKKIEETPSKTMTTTTSGPFGRPVSQAWSDAETAEENGKITGVRLWTGMRVDSIQFKYGTTWGQRHGAQGGSLKEFTLSSDDKISGIILKSGSHIEAIGFDMTNGKRIGPYGSGNAEIMKQQNCELAFVSGTADCQPCQGLNSLTFHWSQ